MSVSRRFNENRKHEIFENGEEQEEINLSSYYDFIHWLALRSCLVYENGIGYIFPYCQPTQVDFMFNKKIKLLVSSYIREIFLITENGETHYWNDMDKIIRSLGPLEIDIINYFPHKLDWSKEYIVKTATNSFSFLTLTDVGKIYYKSGKRRFRGINEIDIKEKITCIGCGCGFYVVVTNNDKIYSWGVNNDGQLGISERKNIFIKQPCEVTGLSGKTIVKVACGKEHTLALSDEGKVYAWGLNCNGQSNFNNKDYVLSPIMVNIANVRKVSDIATIDRKNFVKSSDGLVYIWGFLAHVSISKPVVCERTNVFDVCNSMMAQSPISMIREYTDQEYSILNDLENAFDNPATSDLVIDVKKQFIFVHKAILKIRCQYFRKMFQFDYIENDQGVIELSYYSYVVYKSFIQYLYTGTINLASLEDLLNLLILADEYCEKNLERDCIRIIKKRITISNIFLINKIAEQINKKELEQYCFDFFLKNKEVVMQTENWITQLDLDTKFMFINKANRFFTSCF